MIIFSKIILTTALFLAFSVGAGTEREDAAVNAPTGNAAPEVVTGGDRVAQSANLTATAAVAEARTGTGIGKRRETESGHQKTKVPSDYFCVCCFLIIRCASKQYILNTIPPFICALLLI